jgi:hypothetical protein
MNQLVMAYIAKRMPNLATGQTEEFRAGKGRPVVRG